MSATRTSVTSIAQVADLLSEPPQHPGLCPPPADLDGFARGVLPPADLDAVAAHLADCPACDRAVEGLDAVADPLAAALHQLATTPPPDEGLWHGSAVTDKTCSGGGEPNLPGTTLPARLGGYEVVAELGRGGRPPN